MLKIFAHRGASGYAPENTIPAFLLAIQQESDGIELDVQLTKDGEIVVIHDEKINRVSNGRGYVKDYTWKELQQFSFHNRMPEYEQVKIPTLKEVLDCIKNTNLRVNIEFKTSVFWYPEIEKKTMKLVQDFSLEDRVLYSSFNHYSIREVQRENPHAEVAYLYTDVYLQIEEYAKQTGVTALHPSIYHIYMEHFLENYKRNGLTVRVWTVNSEQDILEMLKKEVDGIFTNYPDRAKQLREQYYTIF